MTATIETDAVTLHDYLRVVRRRKWVVVLAALLVLARRPRLLPAPAEVLRGLG